MSDRYADVRSSLGVSTRDESAEERDRSAAVASLRAVLQPRAVAVVGVSRDSFNLGRRVFDNLIASGFTGAIYPVNPSAAEVHGLRCYASPRQLPGGIELAVVAVPPAAVLEVIDACAAVGIRALVLITAGFAEIGESGRELQRQVVDRARGYGMRLLGPNCMGVLNTNVPFNASFAKRLPPSGPVALASQSGGIGLAILDLAADRGLGVSAFVSLGNKADLSGNDVLEYAESDPATKVVLLYLESFGNPRRFARLAQRISRVKPIVTVKAGRTNAGIRAAGSHTAGLASSDAAVDALCWQSGVIRTGTIDEMLDVAMCLQSQPLPSGRRVAIITNTGGPGVLAADACRSANLLVAEWSDSTRSRLGKTLPRLCRLDDPLDMIASAGAADYGRSIETVLSAVEVDALLVIYTEIDDRQSSEILSAIEAAVTASRRAQGAAKPVLACVMAARTVSLHADTETIPTYRFPEEAIRALGRVASYARWRAAPLGSFPSFGDIRADDARALCRAAVEARGDTWLTFDELRGVLEAFKLPLLPATIARTAEEAVRAAQDAGFPVAAKVVSQRVLHKTDVGGVRLNLRDEQDVRTAFGDIFATLRNLGGFEGVLVQPMVSGGVETIVGLTEDPLFGPLVAFGLGGIHVEILGDVAFRVAPLAEGDADHLLRGIRGFPLLQGYRGHPPADIEALRDLLLRVSRMGEDIPELLELDLNPVIALAPGYGCRIVDARGRVGRAQNLGNKPAQSRGLKGAQ